MLETVRRSLEKGLEELGISGRIETIQTIVKIDQNTEKSPGDLIGLVWFGLVLWHINNCSLFNAKSIFIHINSSISNNSVQHEYTVQLSKTDLFQTIQFSQQSLMVPSIAMYY